MKRDGQHKGWWRRAATTAGASLVLCVAVGGAGCLSRPVAPLDPRTTSVDTEILSESGIDKIDLLLAIDNSSSMADKQQILAAAVPALVTGLLNPLCIDPNTGTPGAQPASPADPCPDSGNQRAFTAVLDVHIGIVSSSIGGHGNASECNEQDTSYQQNDAGHLITRTLNNMGAMSENDGWNGGGGSGEGFLLWDPTVPGGTPKYPGNGISVFGTANSGDNGLNDQLTDLVLGTGQAGCGFESQLESWYRFLVDPHPYGSITPVSTYDYEQSGEDTTVTNERADFLRSDSLLAIVMLTDENDCSVREYGPYPILTNNVPMVRATAQCDQNPLDPCCGSCLSPPKGGSCGSFPECAGMPPLSGADDALNLRCFNTRQRFGVDFLYPIERYSTALTATSLPDPHNTSAGNGVQNDGIPTSTGVTVPNPIYSDLQTDSNKYPKATHLIRDTGRVFLAGIVGVPWQDIAVDPNDPTLAMGFQDNAAMTAGSPNTWDLIIGKPDQYVKPRDPHMVESTTPRSGSDPVTGATIAPTTAAFNADPINGHEWDTTNNDLQYACVFPLPTPKDCTVVNCEGDCPASGPNLDENPLCDPTTPTLQTRAKGYPGVRELQVLQAVGDQGIVGSICPVTAAGDTTATNYGYNAAVQGIINRLKKELAGQCLPQQLKPDPETGAVECLLIEAIKSPSCDQTCKTVNGQPIGGRSPISSDNEGAVASIEANAQAATAGWNCFCQIDQLSDTNTSGQKTDDLHDCLTNTAASFNDDQGKPVNGWCYVDTDVETSADPDLVKNCPETEKRIIRFIGDGNPVNGSTLFITCSGD
jgi:hypothetical protein